MENRLDGFQLTVLNVRKINIELRIIIPSVRVLPQWGRVRVNSVRMCRNSV